MRKDILEARLARLSDKIKALEARALASEDVNEVRSINETIKDINADIDETRAELDAIEAESRAAEPVKVGEEIPQEAEKRTMEQFETKTETREQNPLESMEYRKAFMAYVQKGTPIEMRDGLATATPDTGALIPLTVMNEVINTVKGSHGNLYRKVRKIQVQGGVQFAVGALKASFKWINESTVSPRQKLSLGKVTFGYHTAEIRIAQTFLSSIVTLEVFENEIAKVIAEAYLEAMDYGIVNGTGDGQMTGILNDARVTNTVTMTAAQFADWTAWRKRLFAQLPIGYRAGEFIFPMSTVESYLETMHDNNNNPIFAQAAGLSVNEEGQNGRFFGREISIVDPDIIADFDAASAGDVVGIYWQPNEYAINENFGFTMRRYFDEETNEWVDKALVVVDGKVLNPTGYYKIVKA